MELLKKEKKIRVLIVSETAWNTNNSFGNSYASIFDGLDNVEIANVYCRDGVVNDRKVSRAYKITAKMLLKGIINRKYCPGSEVNVEDILDDRTELSENQKRLLNFGRKYRFKIFYWGYYLIWLIGRWFNDNLRRFVDDFNPDILFCPVYANSYMNRIVLKIYSYANVPLCTYISDDNYTLRVFSLSPFYWLDRILYRRWVGRALRQSKIVYVISEIQKKEYDSIFQKDCHILTKGIDSDKSKPNHKKPGEVIQLMYAGNIGSDRWKSLAEIVKAIKTINTEKIRVEMDIYTATPITSVMKKELNVENCCRIRGRIPYNEVADKQRKADVLVHVEPTGLLHRFDARHGFSTKLIDYMASNRAILAYGLDNQASINHLKKCDAAFVGHSKDEVYDILESILKNTDLISKYAEKAWNCGCKYHNIKEFHQMLKTDFESLI